MFRYEIDTTASKDVLPAILACFLTQCDYVGRCLNLGLLSVIGTSVPPFLSSHS